MKKRISLSHADIYSQRCASIPKELLSYQETIKNTCTLHDHILCSIHECLCRYLKMVEYSSSPARAKKLVLQRVELDILQWLFFESQSSPSLILCCFYSLPYKRAVSHQTGYFPYTLDLLVSKERQHVPFQLRYTIN